MDKKCNGWSNYATWRVNLEICDDAINILAEDGEREGGSGMIRERGKLKARSRGLNHITIGTGGEVRSVVTVVDRATDYEPFPDADDTEWWAGVLIPIHAVRVVLAQSLPGEVERIGKQINLDPYGFMQTDSLDLAAANAKMIIAAARENA